MKKEKIKTIMFALLILVAGASIFIFTSGILSLIDIESGPRCEVPVEGGSCDFFLELPSGQMVNEGYAFNIRTTALPEDDFKDRQELVKTGSLGPLREEGNFQFYQNVDHYMYLYNVPDWFDVYEYKIEYDFPETVSLRTLNADTRAEAFISVGTIPFEYRAPDVIVCDDASTAYCRENVPNYILKNTIFDSGTRVYWYYRDNFAYQETDVLSISGNSNENKKFGGEVVFKGNELPNIHRKIVVKNELEIQDRGSMTLSREPTVTNFPQSPKVFASYRQNHQITNMKIFIGEELYFEEDGVIQEGITYLPDMSKFVNSYCGRLDEDYRDNHCVVKMTIESDRGGIIQISGDVGKLSVSEKPVFDNVNTKNYYPVIVTILAIVILVLFYFVVRGRK